MSLFSELGEVQTMNQTCTAEEKVKIYLLPSAFLLWVFVSHLVWQVHLWTTTRTYTSMYLMKHSVCIIPLLDRAVKYAHCI